MPPEPLNPVKVAPEFDLPRLSEAYLEGSRDSVSLAEHQGKIVVLAFSATWCPPCAGEYEELQALQTEYGHRGLQVMGILVKDPPRPAVIDWIRARGATGFPTLVQESGDLARAYGSISLPNTVVIGPDGLIIDQFTGWYEGKSALIVERIRPFLAASEQ